MLRLEPLLKLGCPRLVEGGIRGGVGVEGAGQGHGRPGVPLEPDLLLLQPEDPGPDGPALLLGQLGAPPGLGCRGLGRVPLRAEADQLGAKLGLRLDGAGVGAGVCLGRLDSPKEVLTWILEGVGREGERDGGGGEGDQIMGSLEKARGEAKAKAKAKAKAEAEAAGTVYMLYIILRGTHRDDLPALPFAGPEAAYLPAPGLGQLPRPLQLPGDGFAVVEDLHSRRHERVELGQEDGLGLGQGGLGQGGPLSASSAGARPNLPEAKVGRRSDGSAPAPLPGREGPIDGFASLAAAAAAAAVVAASLGGRTVASAGGGPALAAFRHLPFCHGRGDGRLRHAVGGRRGRMGRGGKGGEDWAGGHGAVEKWVEIWKLLYNTNDSGKTKDALR